MTSFFQQKPTLQSVSAGRQNQQSQLAQIQAQRRLFEQQQQFFTTQAQESRARTEALSTQQPTVEDRTRPAIAPTTRETRSRARAKTQQRRQPVRGLRSAFLTRGRDTGTPRIVRPTLGGG